MDILYIKKRGIAFRLSLKVGDEGFEPPTLWV